MNRQYLEDPGPPDAVEYNISGIAYLTDEIGKLVVFFPSVEGEGDCECTAMLLSVDARTSTFVISLRGAVLSHVAFIAVHVHVLASVAVLLSH